MNNPLENKKGLPHSQYVMSTTKQEQFVPLTFDFLYNNLSLYPYNLHVNEILQSLHLLLVLLLLFIYCSYYHRDEKMGGFPTQS